MPKVRFAGSNVEGPLPVPDKVRDTWSPAKAQFSPRLDELGSALSNNIF